ncbi:cation:proton antiporter [Methanonatronarchaeum sp. AMET6-2]|uniref:cation:proton antiporter n=1 Tax=Methanonatronarchaeum sp. AMET6-2 TaxID=2933293 RepID=UPI0012086983|nr:cation:proton antiporter [Methanonatronarchaeum sp. AMET6-2]RZN61407.1 MAG: potassium transporter Kef [Methanonatronarchaeia archaeon]RZN62129.1 MAG: potassium transporter Kef [Methanonatronarchaeia archaeon]UOY09646.1 cation:proton antiporter [Methanonatronarchaeum sp. AMET6-2]
MPVEIAYLTDFAIVVVGATVIGILAQKLKQPTIVAYILTGVILGPVLFDIVTEEGLVEVMAELGLGFLLFLLGLKFRFKDIKEILRPIINISVGQTILQTALAFAVAWALGFTLIEVIIIALATVFGATPVIVKILTDKDEITTLPGKIDVGVLIVQDIYLVVVLALLGAESLANPGEIALSLGQIFLLMSAVAFASIASSRYLLPRLFRRIADQKDIFFIMALSWAFLFIYISEFFDLSIEVGAFLAGLSLAQLPYSDELQDRMKPLTDFFILVFFSSIGLQLAADELFYYWFEAVVASIILAIGNFWIMFYLIWREDFSIETSFIGSVNMIQVSEFSLVVGALALHQGFIEAEILGYLSLMALMTMSVSTYIINYNREIYIKLEHLFSVFDSPGRKDTELKEYRNHAVVVGYDELAEAVVPVLREHFGEVVVVDRKTDNIDLLEKQDHEYVYGDFKHTEVRKAVNLKYADFVFSSSEQVDVNKQILEEVKKEAICVFEASNSGDAEKLRDLGADKVFIPKELSGEMMGEYLETYLKDPDEFSDVIQSDLWKIRGELDGY